MIDKIFTMRDLTNQVGHRKLLLEFSKVFPDEQAKPFSEYLEGFNKDDVLQANAFLLAINPVNSKFENVYEILRNWFSEANQGFLNYIHQSILRIQRQLKTEVAFVNPVASLRMLEFAFAELNNTNQINNAEFEVNFFKSYLVLNESINSLEGVTKESLEGISGDLRWPLFNFCSKFSDFEYLYLDIGEISITQFIKSTYLFDFLSSHASCEPILLEFYEYYNCRDWKHYLKSYFPLVGSILKKPKETHTNIIITRDENYDESCAFLDKFILQDEQIFEEYDFKSTRARPFYKVEDGHYRIIYDLFVVENLYTQSYFKAWDIHKKLPAQHKHIKDFRRFLTQDFSENYLMYRVLRDCFPDEYLHLSGEDMRGKGEADYYIRDGNKIFLFENKDVLIASEIKNSCDFRLLEPELKKRFYSEVKDGKLKHGAVLQLITNIKLILTNKFSPDDKINVKHAVIYPILILHSNQYNTLGLNRLVDHWFQGELVVLRNEGYDTKPVRPLTIIDINDLILYQDYLKSRQIVIENLIENYSRQSRSSIYILPFSNLLTNYALGQGFKKPPDAFLSAARKLFE